MLPETLEGKEFQEYLFDITKDNSKFRHVNYSKTTEHAEEMAVHARGKKPKKILEEARPREDPAVREYRLNSWESITLSEFDKAISILQKIFNPKLYSIYFPPQPSGPKIKEEDSLEKYIMNDYPSFDSVFAFAREVLLKQMIADPNGVIAVVPTNYNVAQNEYLTPVAVLFNSSQVLDYDNANYFVIKDQKTVPLRGREGAIIHIFTTNSIFTYHETEDFNKRRVFVETASINHNFGIMPIWFLGGVTNSESFPYYYLSFFNACLPHWNKAIRHESDLDGAYVNHLHPQKWELTIDCDYETEGHRCYEGIIKTDKPYRCPSCKGTGKKSVKSPYDVYSVSQDKFTEKPEIIPPAGYINVPVEIVEKLENRVEKLINKGFASINMDIINQLGSNQSGVAKEFDRTELHSFMQQISDYAFDNHIPNIIYFINRYRYGVVLGNKYREYEPMIAKPTAFDTLSIKELTIEIATAKTAQVNPDYVTAIEKDAAVKRFSTNPAQKDKLLAILDLNPFNNRTVEDKSSMLLNGSVAIIDVVISDNITQFVERAILEVNGFLDLDRRKQREILKKYAQEVLASQKTISSDLLSPDLGQGVNTPVDVEAEAKAKLKGSVGGVQGILAIQQQVSEGVTPYAAGLAILELIYGIGGEEGKRILGDENEIKSKMAQKSAEQVKQLNQINDTGSASE